MRFEKSIEIAASQVRVWEVISDLEAWPQRIETVDTVELLTPAPITKGSRVRLKQPKLPRAPGTSPPGIHPPISSGSRRRVAPPASRAIAWKRWVVAGRG
jgi:hypothetical protein